MTDPATAILAQPAPRQRRFSMFGRPAAWLAGFAFAAVAVAAAFVAAAAAAVIAILGVIALLVMRLSPRRPAAGPVTLEGRRTAEGWIAEASR